MTRKILNDFACFGVWHGMVTRKWGVFNGGGDHVTDFRPLS